MAIKFNVEPYYDDYETPTPVDGLSPKEKYNRILFRPGHAVQARELTQLQSILQNQVTQMGDHFFDEGAQIIPGGVTAEVKTDYIKLASDNITNYDSLEGLVFTDSSGLEAKVVKAIDAEGLDPATLYVKYQNSGSANKSVFDDSDSITSGSYTATLASSNSTGFGSVASIEDGVYYIKGHMVIVKSATIILDKYASSPSYDVGLEIYEKIETSAGDSSLNDNANGSPNYAAPGAHRYQIKTTFVKLPLNLNTGQIDNADLTDNFLLLIRLREGTVVKKVRNTDYSVLEETLARRTFDESGNYTVRPFLMDIQDHASDPAKLRLGLEPSKAYVSGYEIETLATSHIDTNKAQDFGAFNNASISTSIGNYLKLDASTIGGAPEIDTFGLITMKQSSTTIGTCRARSFKFDGINYRLYVFDIQFNSGKSLANLTNLSGAGTPPLAFSATVTTPKLFDADKNIMVFPMAFDRIKSCIDTSAYTIKRFSQQQAAGGVVTSILPGANTQFEALDEQNWIVIDETTGLAYRNGDGSGVTITRTASSAALGGLLNANGDYTLFAPVKTTGGQRQKTIAKDFDSFASPTNTMTLQKADGYTLLGVYDSGDTGTDATSSDTDIKEYYTFNSGQLDNYYDRASISLKTETGFQPAGRLLVEYEYFVHGSGGSFFTVESYSGITDTSGSTLNYSDIPTFTDSTGNIIELRSAVDFRTRKDNGTLFDTTVANICPQPNRTFSADIEYYLNRIDKVFIDKNGKFGIIEGVSALEPELPENPKDAMVLYDIYMRAYTEGPREVFPAMYDNKRYTMRDIGKLEKRLNSLEYYTSLSLLETDAINRQVTDANGLQRGKAGFVVDKFTTHAFGDVTNREYSSAIDRKKNALRPTFSSSNVRLINSALSSNVQVTGDLVTLPYTETSLVQQNQASNWINVNPFEVFSWEGNIEISPSSDEWRETTRRPNLVIDQEGVYDAMMSIIDATDSLGTVWNEWQTSWTGETFTGSAEERVGRKITTTSTFDVTTKQQRQGITTGVVPDTISSNIGDRVVEVNFSPYMRSRIVTFKASRMKPNTTVYPFFDGIDVSSYVREESTFIRYTDLDNPTIEGVNTLTAHPLGSSALTTNAAGEIIGSFFIPHNASLAFKSGSRSFKLSDSSTNDEAAETTSASANYNARGLIETKENVTISTRIPLIQQSEVVENRTVNNSRTEITGVRWVDPLAQSFMINKTGGIFLTSLDLYFHTKDSSLPVTLQIREMNQGIPTQTIVPFSEVILDPADVNVVNLNISNPDPTLATNFAFSSPVYLQENQEYCFVILANSKEYNVWYAGISEDDYTTSKMITKQPYAGVMFKSQNASTWSPDQNKDIKFTLNRALFDTSLSSEVVFENGSIATTQLGNNPFKTIVNSTTVTVLHKNHHFDDGDEVTFSGASAFNGVTINGTYTVANSSIDQYDITSTSASGTGIGGGDSISATQNQLINNVMPYVQQINFPGTNTTWGIKMTEQGGTIQSGYSPIIVNQNYSTETPKIISSDDNSVTKTLFLKGDLTSTLDNISPVIDLERCSVITVANKINSPSPDNETNNDSSAKAKYIMKNITLATAADGLRIWLDNNRPSQTDIDVYYKAGNSEEDITGSDWVLAPPVDTLSYSDGNTYTESEYEIDTTDAFTVFKIKIVLKSTNSSRIPTCKALRIIALTA